MILKTGTGKHIIFPLGIYRGTFQRIIEILVNYNIEISFLDYDNIGDVNLSPLLLYIHYYMLYASFCKTDAF